MKTETVVIGVVVVAAGLMLWKQMDDQRKAREAAAKSQQKPDLMGQVSGFLGSSTQMLSAGSGLATSTANLMDRISSLFGSSSGSTAPGSAIDERGPSTVAFA